MNGDDISPVVRIHDDANAEHEWVGNDENNHHLHQPVNIDEVPFTLRLRWKTSSEGYKYNIGTYQLDMRALLRENHVRWEDEPHRTVRLRILHDKDGLIRITRRKKERGIPIGWLKE